MEIIVIAALAENRVIGNQGTIPWHIKADFQRFKALTLGHPCIMGRKTWESLPKRPLPDRPNIVISSNPAYQAPGAEVVTGLAEALDFCHHEAKIFICGGQSLYTQALEIADTLELTHVAQAPEGDTFFPEFDPALWKLKNQEDHEGYSFRTWIRQEKSS